MTVTRKFKDMISPEELRAEGTPVMIDLQCGPCVLPGALSKEAALGNAEQTASRFLVQLRSLCIDDSEAFERALVRMVLEAKACAVAKTTTILDDNGLGAPRDPDTGEEMPEKASPAYRAQLEYFGALMSAREAVGK